MRAMGLSSLESASNFLLLLLRVYIYTRFALNILYNPDRILCLSPLILLNNQLEISQPLPIKTKRFGTIIWFNVKTRLANQRNDINFINILRFSVKSTSQTH